LDGRVDCWPYSSSVGLYNPPVRDFTQIDMGSGHACGLQRNGQGICWGDGQAGVTGGNNLGQSVVPTGPSNVFTSIAAGVTHSCARKASGAVVCWGSNASNMATPPYNCGDGVRTAGEACDQLQSPVVGGDGCSADCLSREECGNAIVDPATVPTDGRPAASAEVCDDGGNRYDDTCDDTCQRTWAGNELPNASLHYSFDDQDLYGNAYSSLAGVPFAPGEIVGAGVTTGEPGVVNEAVSLDGDPQSYINAGSNPTQATTAISVAAWIHQYGTTSEDSHIAYYRTNTGGLLGWDLTTGPLENDPSVSFEAGSAATGGDVSQVMSNAFSWQEWTHVVATMDLDGVMTLYINGQQAAATYADQDISYSGSELKLGQGFNGAIDEMSMWTSALNEEEVRTLYTAGQSGRRLDAQTQAYTSPCAQILAAMPSAADGIYSVPLSPSESVNVFCDMTGGGWTMLMKKSSGFVPMPPPPPGDLLVNGGFETPVTVTNQIQGWTVVSGTLWTASTGFGGTTAAFEGTRLLYAGNQSGAPEIRQDVNVSSFATAIDAGQQFFSFTGFVRSPDTDSARIIVEYRNAANTGVIQTYDSTAIATNSGPWQRLSDIRLAPAGTRWIRVRVISTRNAGTSNDGYVDYLVLRADNLPGPVSSPNLTLQQLWTNGPLNDTINTLLTRAPDTNRADYSSRFIQSWDRFSQAKVEVIDSNAVVRAAIYNTRGAGVVTWFAPDRFDAAATATLGPAGNYTDLPTGGAWDVLNVSRRYGVPERNLRAFAVYQSLVGTTTACNAWFYVNEFTPTGTTCNDATSDWTVRYSNQTVMSPSATNITDADALIIFAR
jgi:hypothetical protein